MENHEQSNNKNVSLSLLSEYNSDSESEYTPSNENAAETDGDSDNVELSEMVLKNNIINACAHGPLPSGESDGEVTTHMIIDSSENAVSQYDVTMYRVDDEDSDDSESDSSEESSDSDVDSIKDIEGAYSGDELSGNQAEILVPPKVPGEIGLDELPPIEDLTISIPAQETTKIGKICSIVDRLVVVQGLPETPAVDIDSILFLENGAKPLGQVFDVFGPVSQPHYCVRFNSADHIAERGVDVNMDVFIAPDTPHTNYVIVQQLMKVKGCDASWLNDVETPPNQAEFSDDEEERRVRREKKQNRQDSQSTGGETSKDRKILEAKRKTPQFRNRNSNYRGPPVPVYHGRIPPPHPDMNPPPGFTRPMFAPPMFVRPRMRFGRPPFLGAPNMMPFRHNMPTFGSNYCNIPGAHPQWRQPPPPGT
ncbi:H/ACA ribonucleoprotein complex non-core subunit NAF1 [Pieris brassicae]|uniref:H/ACA ribonucleoprotein complex non-core subunit NAF1 n=1 Tax=Pieris brassicae TaxID=7116 RepID=A0A9P0XCY0_PIEBR|nr:H/ACA ribonucleoprotein complex non-core subunit NAF1 [Pieris brassicae]XP_045523170.1 H/ACA ribonucleoprotein complex non-core subunit NAF1 [Pieris brassicae]CAH4030191.1 unnamed protein product [Pieris brassicae]